MQAVQAIEHIHPLRGDDMRPAAEYRLGSTKVLVDDSMVARTPEDIAKVEQDLYAALWAIEFELDEREAV